VWPRLAALALLGLPLEGESELPALPDRSSLRAFRRPVLLVAGEGDPTAKATLTAADLKRRALKVVSAASSAADEVDCDARFPHEAIAVAKSQRLLGIMVPNELGGEGADIDAHCLEPPSRLVVALDRQCHPGPEGQDVASERVVFLLCDRTLVEQLLSLGDLLGRIALCRDRLHVVVHLRSLGLGPLEVALVHAVVLRDHVDEDAQEWQHECEDEQPRLSQTRQVAPPEDAPHTPNSVQNHAIQRKNTSIVHITSRNG
jgi:hypothetical protein